VDLLGIQESKDRLDQRAIKDCQGLMDCKGSQEHLEQLDLLARLDRKDRLVRLDRLDQLDLLDRMVELDQLDRKGCLEMLDRRDCRVDKAQLDNRGRREILD
jgi:hypothetical protein